MHLLDGRPVYSATDLVNAQVSAIRERLPETARRRVGTVDKFQGQEAACRSTR